MILNPVQSGSGGGSSYTSVEVEGENSGIVKLRYLTPDGTEEITEAPVYNYSLGGHTVISCQPGSVGVISVTVVGLVLIGQEAYVKPSIRDGVLHLEVRFTEFSGSI